MLDSRLCVLYLVFAAAAASGITTPLCAQKRGNSVRWCVDCQVYPLRDLTRHDLRELGLDERFRRVLTSMVWTPHVQRLGLAGVSTALGPVEGREYGDGAQVLLSSSPATARWAVPDSAPSFDPWAVAFQQAGHTGQQRTLLPACDDVGNPISRTEIEARMRGGGSGAGVGGLLGGLVGGGLGLLLGFSICPIEYLGPGCSPRDEAYRTVAILSGFAWGIAAGVFVGGEIGEIDRWEALEQIRAERRGTASPGGER